MWDSGVIVTMKLALTRHILLWASILIGNAASDQRVL